MMQPQSRTKNTMEEIIAEFFATFGTDKNWQSLLEENISFTSPMDKVSGKNKFVELDMQFR